LKLRSGLNRPPVCHVGCSEAVPWLRSYSVSAPLAVAPGVSAAVAAVPLESSLSSQVWSAVCSVWALPVAFTWENVEPLSSQDSTWPVLVTAMTPVLPMMSAAWRVFGEVPSFQVPAVVSAPRFVAVTSRVAVQLA
jgi:hypothetical protein